MRKDNIQELKDLRDYMEIKYGSTYKGAIKTLYAQLEEDAWDKNGLLKPEYMLTKKQEEALVFYIPEVASIMSDYTRRIK